MVAGISTALARVTRCTVNPLEQSPCWPGLFRHWKVLQMGGFGCFVSAEGDETDGRGGTKREHKKGQFDLQNCNLMAGISGSQG